MKSHHYVVRRSKSGRFNFTFLTETGRLTGMVMVDTADRAREDIEREAHRQIGRIAEQFLKTANARSDAADWRVDSDAA